MLLETFDAEQLITQHVLVVPGRCGCAAQPGKPAREQAQQPGWYHQNDLEENRLKKERRRASRESDVVRRA